MTTTKRSEPAATFESDAVERPEWALSDERLAVFQTVRRVDAEGAPLAEPEVVTITMPAKPNPGLALEFLRRARTQGELAISWLIEEAIGVEGYDTLVAELSRMPDPENGQKVVAAIGERVQRAVMGGLEGPKA